MGDYTAGTHFAAYYDRQAPAQTDANDRVQFDQKGSTIVWLDTLAWAAITFGVDAAGASDAVWKVLGTDIDPSTPPAAADIETLKNDTLSQGSRDVIYSGDPEYRYVALEIDDADHEAFVLLEPVAGTSDAERRYFDRATDSTQAAPRARSDYIDEDAETISSASGGWESFEWPSGVDLDSSGKDEWIPIQGLDRATIVGDPGGSGADYRVTLRHPSGDTTQSSAETLASEDVLADFDAAYVDNATHVKVEVRGTSTETENAGAYAL